MKKLSKDLAPETREKILHAFINTPDPACVISCKNGVAPSAVRSIGINHFGRIKYDNRETRAKNLLAEKIKQRLSENISKEAISKEFFLSKPTLYRLIAEYGSDLSELYPQDHKPLPILEVVDDDESTTAVCADNNQNEVTSVQMAPKPDSATIRLQFHGIELTVACGNQHPADFLYDFMLKCKQGDL